jgi:hypothetical protein
MKGVGGDVNFIAVDASVIGLNKKLSVSEVDDLRVLGGCRASQEDDRQGQLEAHVRLL